MTEGRLDDTSTNAERVPFMVVTLLLLNPRTLRDVNGAHGTSVHDGGNLGSHRGVFLQ
jgi:hypothetical protein